MTTIKVNDDIIITLTERTARLLAAAEAATAERRRALSDPDLDWQDRDWALERELEAWDRLR